MPPRTRTQDFSDASDRKVFGDIAEEKARERAANDACRASLQRQIAAAQGELDELTARLQRLVAAQDGTAELLNLNNVKQIFAASFIGKMYEAPNVVRVEVSSRDWAGHAAVAFANQHTEISGTLATAASDSIGALTTYRSKLDESSEKLGRAMEMLLYRVIGVKLLITIKQTQLAVLRSTLSAIPS